MRDLDEQLRAWVDQAPTVTPADAEGRAGLVGLGGLPAVGPAGPGGRPRPRDRRRLLGVAAVAALAVGAAGWFTTRGDDRVSVSNPGGASTTTAPQAVRVVVPAGARLADLPAVLAPLGPGTSGSAVPVGPVEVAAVEQAALRAAAGTPLLPDGQTSAEGLLHPGAYELPAGATVDDLARRAVERTGERLAALDPGPALAALRGRVGRDVDLHDVVVVASIVQAESPTEADRPLVAAVVWNRLADGTVLGVDSVLRYGADRAGVSFQEFTTAEDPYNLRRHRGLPPTPIGAPEGSALAAALRPADSAARYWVRGADGLVFSETPEQFERDRTRCLAEGRCS